ncbi:MAG: hypothetical protein ACRCZO_03880 [Cetobacterium sp.]
MKIKLKLLDKFFDEFKVGVLIIIFQIIMLTFCFYPFYKWNLEIRGTPIEYIFEPGYSGHATYILAVIYSLLNIILLNILNVKKNREIEKLKKQLQKIN